MLIRFVVENFMSFRDQTVFSMAAGQVTHHDNHIINCDGKRILKGGFIFGANAGGKSNLIKAVAFSKEIVLSGLKAVSLDKKYFRIDPQYKDKPGSFQFDIFSDGNYYSYGFSVSYTRKVIIEEWLYRLQDSGKDICIFHLIRDSSNKTSFNTDLSFKNKDDEQRFKVYSMDIGAPKMANSLFLSDIAPRSSNSEKFKDFLNVYNWFERLLIVFPTSYFSKVYYMVHDDTIQESLATYLKYFDTGIEELGTREIPINRLLDGISEEKQQEMLAGIEDALNKAKKDSVIELRNIKGDSVQIEKKMGKSLQNA